MILDTSAIVAIVLGEPTREALLLTAMNAPRTRMSAATYVKLHAVLARIPDAALGRRADRLLAELGTIAGGALDLDGFEQATAVTGVLMLLGAAVSWVGIRNDAALPHEG